MEKIESREKVELERGEGFRVPVAVSTIRAREFFKHPSFADEIFGPSMLLVLVDNDDEMFDIAEGLEGQLTATIHGTDDELSQNRTLLSILATKAGRLIFNSFPTGVEVCAAMVHGGPFPATSDPGSTSVGKRALRRFARLVAYQDFPDSALPDQLKDSNPLEIKRFEE